MKAERIVLLFYCTINIVQYLVVNSTGIYIADALGEPMNAPEGVQIAMLVVSLACCFLGYKFYQIMVAHRVSQRLGHDKRIRLALVAGLIMTFLGFFFFDYGKAETQSHLAFGFIFRVIPTDYLFAFYLCAIPLNRTRPYLLVLAYVGLKVWMGWTGMFAGIFWTVFIRVVNANQHRRWITGTGLGLLLVAFAVAPLIYSVKFYLRWGSYDFAYLGSLTRLVGRIGFYSNSLYLWQNAQQFAAEATANLPAFSYAKDALVAVMPRSLLGLQGENMETVFVSFVSGNFAPGITFYLGALGKSIAYAFMEPEDMPLMLLTMGTLLYLMFKLSRGIIGARSNPILIMSVFQLLLSGSMEEMSYSVYATALIFFICAARFVPVRKLAPPVIVNTR
jgi:hypothetical protein